MKKNRIISNLGRLILPILIALAGFMPVTAGNRYPTTIVVAQDGSGQFTKIQDALNSIPENNSNYIRILVRKGEYREKLFITKNFVHIEGEDKNATKVVYSEARDIFRCDHADDWGVATVNLSGNDILLENLSFYNEYGYLNKEDRTVPCAADSVTHTKVVRSIGHQMVLRSFASNRLRAVNCAFHSLGGDTVSPWNAEEGMYYFRDCTMEGSVDFYCPRGWSLAENCRFICHSKEAAIWHDGSKNEKAKTVLIGCRFEGDPGYKLGRYHRDAQFFLLNCQFDEHMADAAIFQKVATPPNTIQWGHRVNFSNCHRSGGDYSWHQNTIENAAQIEKALPEWAFDGKWNPLIGLNPGTSLKDTVPAATAAVKTTPAYDTVAENMLLYQRANGGWPKQFQKEKVDYHKMLSPSDQSELRSGYEEGIDATIDNNATTKEIRYLCKAFKKTGDKRFLAAAEKGVQYLLKMQYPNGGFPQFYPDFSSYRSQITFNDNAMVNALNVLIDVVEGGQDLDVIPEIWVQPCSVAVQKGVGCILRLQVKQNGVLTGWCAQYNAKTLVPEKARAFELASLSGQEIVGILRFLMRFENPSPAIKDAIIGGINWLKKVKIDGFKFGEIENPSTPTGKDKALIANPGGTTWARFYDLETNEPFFCGRDGVRKTKLEEVEFERRVGYAWYNESPAKLLNIEFPKWEKKWMQ